MRALRYYENIYRTDVDTGRVLIDVSMDRYLDYFHRWDNSTIKKRDLHPDLAQFLDSCSHEIPMNKRLKIVFLIKKIEEDVQKEENVTSSYYHYYQSNLRFVNHEILKKFRLALIVAIIAALFISMHYMIKNPINNLYLSRIIEDGILIGGWVFMWEAFHIIAFQMLDPIQRRKELRRFLDAVLTFNTHL